MRSVVGSAVLLRCLSDSVSARGYDWLRSQSVPEKTLESCDSRLCYDVTAAFVSAVWIPAAAPTDGHRDKLSE